jgi:hypothetical protein
MAKVEIDEAEFINNRKLVGVVQKMLAHPEARKKVLSAQKDIDPNVVIPEIDARAPVDAAIGELSKTVTDFIASQKAEREKDKKDRETIELATKFDTGRASLRNMGVTDEGLKAVEDLMAKHGIIDHEIGWAAFSKLNPEPDPVPPAPGFGFGGVLGDVSKNPDEYIKSLHASKGNDEAALDKRIHEVLTEVRQQNGQQPQRPQFGRRL